MRYESAKLNLSPNKRSLAQVPSLLILCILFVAITNNPVSLSPFLGPSRGSLERRYSTPSVSSTVTLADPSNQEELVLAVDRSHTGEINAHTTPRLQDQSRKQTDLKDEYLEHLLDSQNLTNDYYEYEQGQAQIIVKGRLNLMFYFGKKSVLTILF